VNPFHNGTISLKCSTSSGCHGGRCERYADKCKYCFEWICLFYGKSSSCTSSALLVIVWAWEQGGQEGSGEKEGARGDGGEKGEGGKGEESLGEEGGVRVVGSIVRL